MREENRKRISYKKDKNVSCAKNNNLKIFQIKSAGKLLQINVTTLEIMCYI